MKLPKWVNNDTVALAFLGCVALVAVAIRDTTTTSVALGAIGGYIGAMSQSDKE